MMEALRIGHLSTFYHTAVLLMADPHLSGRLGVPVRWQLFGTGPAIVEAFEKNELDLAYIGLPPAIIGMARGIQITCIAGGHMEGTVLCGGRNLAAFPEIDRIEDIFGQFAGHAIGVPGNGSIHDVILRDYLERFSLAGTVRVINYPWADLVLEAVVKKEVAAAIGTPALAVSVQRYADGKVLFPPSRTYPHNPSYGILANRDLLEKEQHLTEAFLMLHEEATALLRDQPAEAARIISSYVGFVDEAFVLDTLMVSPRYCAQLSDDYVACAMDFVGILGRLGYIEREPGEDEIFDRTLIRRTHPGKDHYGSNGRSHPL
ncbi:MAG: ABC transporter substrate-binding protein [Nitrospiraceae bacterium]|nr:ABC transporter substrate-binding protein [Nitrospiraceae bacterium]